MKPYRRSMRAVGITLACYALLVATHLGEFWPFSIYPMFSQAGNPWTRALVRDVPSGAGAVGIDAVSAEVGATPWQTVSLERLPGEAFPLVPQGIFQNDLANYVKKTEVWDERRIRGLRGFFRQSLVEDPTRRLLVMRVQGRLVERGDSVVVAATPFALLTADTTRFNPGLDVPVRP